MRQRSASNIAYLCLLLFIFIINSNAQSGAQETATADDATVSAGNTTLSRLQVNTTSDGFQILTDSALNVTGRAPECDWYPSNELTVASCEDAIAQVPDTHSFISDPFGQPLQIPMRYSSCM